MVLSGVATVAATVGLLAWSGSIGFEGSADLVWSLAGLQLALLLCAALWLVMRITVSRETAIAEAAVPLAAIGDLVTWHDSFGDVVLASAASAAVLGVAPRTLCGGGLLARVHVSDRPSYLKALSDAANGCEAVTVRFRLHAEEPDEPSSGRHAVIWAEMRAYRVRPADWTAGVSVVIASTRDISAQQQHAEEIEAARREAERANELKGRFLATVSHELRTPLNAIIGFSELLSADHPFLMTEERRKEYAQIIRSSGHHLLEIVNTLLDISKIDSGNFDFEPEPFGFGELATSVCNLMQLKAEEANVVIDRRIGSDLPDISADRRACRQILINLVSNAVKFTPAQGRVTVTVTATADDLVLSVADTGIGIAEADLPRLGDPFFQSGDVHRRNHEGTGLGLSVVRGLVGLHRGRMSIESGTGAGTTVTIALPMRGEADPARSKPVTVQTRPRIAPRRQERMSA